VSPLMYARYRRWFCWREPSWLKALTATHRPPTHPPIPTAYQANTGFQPHPFPAMACPNPNSAVLRYKTAKAEVDRKAAEIAGLRTDLAGRGGRGNHRPAVAIAVANTGVPTKEMDALAGTAAPAGGAGGAEGVGVGGPTPPSYPPPPQQYGARFRQKFTLGMPLHCIVPTPLLPLKRT